MLVVIDWLSRWVEAIPSKDQSVTTVIKFLYRKIMPRFGIQSEISSDNGSNFIQKTVKSVVQQLRIKQRLSVYHSVTRNGGKSEWDIQEINNISASVNWIG